MKNLIVSFAMLSILLSVFSCRETTEEKAEDAIEAAAEDTENNLEAAGEAIEEAAQETEEALEEAGEAVENAAKEMKSKVDSVDDES